MTDFSDICNLLGDNCLDRNGSGLGNVCINQVGVLGSSLRCYLFPVALQCLFQCPEFSGKIGINCVGNLGLRGPNRQCGGFTRLLTRPMLPTARKASREAWCRTDG